MSNDNNHFKKWNRRDILKTLGGIPFVGAVWYSGANLAGSAIREKQFLLETLNIKSFSSSGFRPHERQTTTYWYRGFGIRGEQLAVIEELEQQLIPVIEHLKKR